MLFTESRQPGSVIVFKRASEDSRFLLSYQLSRINLVPARIDFSVAFLLAAVRFMRMGNLFRRQLVPHGKLASSQVALRHR
jgi:hypothetical protein